MRLASPVQRCLSVAQYAAQRALVILLAGTALAVAACAVGWLLTPGP